MKNAIIIILAILVVVLAGVLIFTPKESADTWICENGQWVKSGNPQTQMPTTGCGNGEEEEETITVKAFFNNSRLDPEASCNKVFTVERKVPKTQAVGRAALEELLKGTTAEEEAAGFFTSINPGVNIVSLTIENGTAEIEFDEQLEWQVGGSCRVSAIRAQIIETLKQFPTVDNVIISINGRTEDILQP